MADLRIKVGASADRSVERVFLGVEAAAAKARARVKTEADAAGAAIAPPITKGAEKAARSLNRLYDELARSRDVKGPSVRGIQVFARDTENAFKQVKRAAAESARDTSRELAKIEAAENRAASASAKFKAKYFTGVSAGRVGRGGLMGAGRSVFGVVGRGIGRASQMAHDLAHDAGIETDSGAFAKSFIERQAKASDIAHSGYIPGAKGPNGQRQDASALQRESLATATQYGQDPAKVLEGLQKFVAITGDLDTGRKIMGDMAKLSLATGSSMENVVEAAGEISAKLGDIPDKANVVHAVMRQIAGAGKMGAVEMRDFAAQLGKIAGYASRVGGDVDKNIGEMGILMQLARQKGGAGSAAQAATSTAAFMETLATPAKIKKYEEITGRHAYLDAGRTKLASPEVLIAQALGSTNGDQVKLHEIFGKRAGNVVSGAANIFTGAGGGKAGEEAVHEYFDKLRASTLSLADENQAASEQMNTAQARAQRFNDMLQQVADGAMTNVLKEMDKFPGGADQMIKAVSGMAGAFVELTPLLLTFGTRLLSFLGIQTPGSQDPYVHQNDNPVIGPPKLESVEELETRKKKAEVFLATTHHERLENERQFNVETANSGPWENNTKGALRTQVERDKRAEAQEQADIIAIAMEIALRKTADVPQKVHVVNTPQPPVHAAPPGMSAGGTPRPAPGH